MFGHTSLFLRIRVSLFLGVFVSLSPTAGTVIAQCELTKLLAPGATGDVQYGTSIAIDGDVVVIGADNAEVLSPQSGAAYVYRFDGTSWEFEQTLFAADGDGPDHFGNVVAIDGDTIAVGAFYDDDLAHNCGSVYIFRYDGFTWIERAKLIAFDGDEHDYFGVSVALDGGDVLVCAFLDDDNGTDSGSVYIFRHDTNGTPSDPSDDTWPFEQKIVPPDGHPQQSFARDVAADNGTMLIGACCDNGVGYPAGATYVYYRDDNNTPEDPGDDTWQFETKLYASDSREDDRFGNAVEILGDMILIGAYFVDSSQSKSGAVYVFDKIDSAWMETAKLEQTEGYQAFFGSSLAIEGDLVLIGAPGDWHDSVKTGKAYLLRRTHGEVPDPRDMEWTLETMFSARDGQGGDKFGWAVGLAGTHSFISAVLNDNETGNDGGATYVFENDGLDCNNNRICDARDIAEGESLDLNGNEIPDDCDCPGDLNSDWRVDLSDLSQLLSSYGQTGGLSYWDGDLDRDGQVDLSDLSALLSVYGVICE